MVIDDLSRPSLESTAYLLTIFSHNTVRMHHIHVTCLHPTCMHVHVHACVCVGKCIDAEIGTNIKNGQDWLYSKMCPSTLVPHTVTTLPHMKENVVNVTGDVGGHSGRTNTDVWGQSESRMVTTRFRWSRRRQPIRCCFHSVPETSRLHCCLMQLSLSTKRKRKRRSNSII